MRALRALYLRLRRPRCDLELLLAQDPGDTKLRVVALVASLEVDE